jgi:hypothetical protein
MVKETLVFVPVGHIPYVSAWHFEIREVRGIVVTSFIRNFESLIKDSLIQQVAFLLIEFLNIMQLTVQHMEHG